MHHLSVMTLYQRCRFSVLCLWSLSRYTGWKNMFDADTLREPAVKFYLNQALDMMNRAVGGTFQPGARENMAYFVSTERRLANKAYGIKLSLLPYLVKGRRASQDMRICMG